MREDGGGEERSRKRVREEEEDEKKKKKKEGQQRSCRSPWSRTGKFSLKLTLLGHTRERERREWGSSLSLSERF